jgi:hypothetical protein
MYMVETLWLERGENIAHGGMPSGWRLHYLLTGAVFIRCGCSCSGTMQVLQRQNKGAHLNTIERFHIYSEYTNDNHLNDNQTIFPNKIFDDILNPYHP